MDIIPVRQLHREVMALLASGFIAGSGNLYRLEQKVWACHALLSGEKSAVCAAIARLLDQIAKKQEGNPILPDEAAALGNAIRQPLSQAVDFLLDRDSGVSAPDLIMQLRIK